MHQNSCTVNTGQGEGVSGVTDFPAVPPPSTSTCEDRHEKGTFAHLSNKTDHLAPELCRSAAPLTFTNCRGLSQALGH